MTALTVFDLQRFCFQDGPGIRTTVFLKGCSLRCAWCHNPESLRSEPELLYRADKCLQCMLCVGVCPSGAHALAPGGHIFDRRRCRACGRCAAICPARAPELAGETRDVDSLVEELLRDKDIFDQTGGGMTVSGGEPFLQPEGLRELLSACRDRGMHTAVETAGNVPGENILSALPHIDLLLWDVKAASPETHRRGTGGDNARILSNLRTVFDRYRGELWIRIPVVPGINDSGEEMAAIRGLLRGGKVGRVELLPYHDIAASKYQALGLECRMSGVAPPDKSLLRRLREIMAGDWLVT